MYITSKGEWHVKKTLLLAVGKKLDRRLLLSLLMCASFFSLSFLFSHILCWISFVLAKQFFGHILLTKINRFVIYSGNFVCHCMQNNGWYRTKTVPKINMNYVDSLIHFMSNKTNKLMNIRNKKCNENKIKYCECDGWNVARVRIAVSHCLLELNSLGNYR